MKSPTKRNVAPEESERPVRWLLRGRTYVAITRVGPGPFDENRFDSVTDEDTPARS